MSDSLEIIATGEGEKRLASVLSLCTDWENDAALFGSWAHCDGGLRFTARGGTPFPIPIEAAEAAKMALGVIANLNEWPREPDIDGDCQRGWRVEHDWSGTKVLPFWMIYHK